MKEQDKFSKLWLEMVPVYKMRHLVASCIKRKISALILRKEKEHF